MNEEERKRYKEKEPMREYNPPIKSKRNVRMIFLIGRYKVTLMTIDENSKYNFKKSPFFNETRRIRYF